MQTIDQGKLDFLPEQKQEEGFFIPNVYTKEEQKQTQVAQEQAQEQASFSTVTDAAMESQWVGNAILRQLGNEDLADDPDFTLDEEKLLRYSDGLPEDYMDEFEDVRSEAQAMQLRASLLKHMEVQQNLMSKGAAAGVAASLTFAIADPVSIGASVATEGVLAPFIYGTKLTRMGRAVRAGIVGAAASAPVEGYLASQDPDYDLSDAVMSMVVGGLATGGLRYGLDANDPMVKAATQLQVDELRRAGATPGPAVKALSDAPLTADGQLKSTYDFNDEWFKQAERNDAETYRPGIRIDRAADTFSSETPEVRILSHALFDDPNTAKGATQGETASLFMLTNFDAAMRRRVLAEEEAFKEYRKAARKAGQKADIKIFREEVGHVLRGGKSDNPAVNKMAAADRKERDKIANLAQNPGRGKPVLGAENMTLENYLNRRYSLSKIEAKIATVGRSAVTAQLAKAIIGVAPENAQKLAEHVIDVVSRSRSGTLDFKMFDLPPEDLATLLEREHGIKAVEATRIAQSLQRLTQGDDVGKAANLKSRIDLDELEIEDLLENDSMSLFSTYARTMYGHIGLARQGIDSELTFKELLSKAGAAQANTPPKNQMDAWKRQRELKNTQEAYDYIVGRSVGDDPGSMAGTLGRFARKINYVRQMNIMGISALGDLGNVIAQTGIKSFIRHVPELLAIHRRIRNGEFIDELSEETAQLTGWLNRDKVMAVQTRINEFGATGQLKESAWSKTERGLDFMGRVTSRISLMNGMLEISQRLAGKAMIQTFLDVARTGKAHVLGEARLAEMGFTPDLIEKIKGEMMKKGGASWDRAGRIKKLNIENWDYETRLKFGAGLRRWGSYIIQEQHFGSLPGWADTTGGKILGQFRTFQMGAWAKNTTYNMKHRDLRAGAAFLSSLLTGTLAYYAYVQATGLGRDDREKYVNDRLKDWETIATQGFMRGGISSFIPGMVDTGLAATLNDPLFGFRTSGLDSNLILGIPTVDTGLKVTAAYKEAAELVRGDRVTEDTVRAMSSILPWQNALGIRQFINNLASSKPRDYD